MLFACFFDTLSLDEYNEFVKDLGMIQQQAIERWKETAKDDYVVAQDLIASHHNDWGLFKGYSSIYKRLVCKN